MRELWFSKLLYFIKESEQGVRETFKFNSSLSIYFFLVISVLIKFKHAKFILVSTVTNSLIYAH